MQQHARYCVTLAFLLGDSSILSLLHSASSDGDDDDPPPLPGQEMEPEVLFDRVARQMHGMVAPTILQEVPTGFFFPCD